MSTHSERRGTATGDIVTGVIAFILITVLTVILLQIVFFLMRDHEVERKFVASQQYHTMRSRQERRLQEPVRWSNDEKTTVGMPIEQAMAAVVKRHAVEADER